MNIEMKDLVYASSFAIAAAEGFDGGTCIARATQATLLYEQVQEEVQENATRDALIDLDAKPGGIYSLGEIHQDIGMDVCSRLAFRVSVMRGGGGLWCRIRGEPTGDDVHLIRKAVMRKMKASGIENVPLEIDVDRQKVVDDGQDRSFW
jgi:hypothetical protein